MRFKCDKCSSQYSIADKKVKGRVLKIRCKKCSHTITVRSSDQSKVSDPITVAKKQRNLQVKGISIETTQEGSGGSSERTVVARIPTKWLREIQGQKEKPTWFFVLYGNPVGPVRKKELLGYIEQGEIHSETLLWNAGWPEWIKVQRVPEINQMLAPSTYPSAEFPEPTTKADAVVLAPVKKARVERQAPKEVLSVTSTPISKKKKDEIAPINPLIVRGSKPKKPVGMDTGVFANLLDEASLTEEEEVAEVARQRSERLKTAQKRREQTGVYRLLKSTQAQLRNKPKKEQAGQFLGLLNEASEEVSKQKESLRKQTDQSKASVSASLFGGLLEEAEAEEAKQIEEERSEQQPLDQELSKQTPSEASLFGSLLEEASQAEEQFEQEVALLGDDFAFEEEEILEFGDMVIEEDFSPIEASVDLDFEAQKLHHALPTEPLNVLDRIDDEAEPEVALMPLYEDDASEQDKGSVVPLALSVSGSLEQSVTSDLPTPPGGVAAFSPLLGDVGEDFELELKAGFKSSLINEIDPAAVADALIEEAKTFSEEELEEAVEAKPEERVEAESEETVEAFELEERVEAEPEERVEADSEETVEVFELEKRIEAEPEEKVEAKSEERVEAEPEERVEAEPEEAFELEETINAKAELEEVVEVESEETIDVKADSEQILQEELIGLEVLDELGLARSDELRKLEEVFLAKEVDTSSSIVGAETEQERVEFLNKSLTELSSSENLSGLETSDDQLLAEESLELELPEEPSGENEDLALESADFDFDMGAEATSISRNPRLLERNEAEQVSSYVQMLDEDPMGLLQAIPRDFIDEDLGDKTDILPSIKIQETSEAEMGSEVSLMDLEGHNRDFDSQESEAEAAMRLAEEAILSGNFENIYQKESDSGTSQEKVDAGLDAMRLAEEAILSGSFENIYNSSPTEKARAVIKKARSVEVSDPLELELPLELGGQAQSSSSDFPEVKSYTLGGSFGGGSSGELEGARERSLESLSSTAGIPFENQALSVEVAESGEEDEFFKQKASRWFAVNARSEDEGVIELKLPPLPIMPEEIEEPIEELHEIDDADIIEIKKSMELSWKQKILIFTGIFLLLGLLVTPLIMKGPFKNFSFKNTHKIQKINHKRTSKKLSEKERKERAELLGTGDPLVSKREVPLKIKKTYKRRTRLRSRKVVVASAKGSTEKYDPSAALLRSNRNSSKTTQDLEAEKRIEERLKKAGLAVKGSKPGHRAVKVSSGAENISKDLLKRVLNEITKQRGRVTYCYEQYLKVTTISGRMSVLMVIKDTGSVSKVRIQTKRFRRTRIAQCIRRLMKRWRFASFSGRKVLRIEVPYLFRVSG